jgi:5'-deoxynucleotidase YfbR-like HD superfamily hydrolase
MAENGYDGYMQTFSGDKFYPFDLTKFVLNFDDIAHALSNICRYAGHTKRFYSVAEHCVVMAELFPDEAKAALLHDAAEAYFGDLPRPIKQMFPQFREMEHTLLSLIFKLTGTEFNDKV